jgi:hypothetical protein
LLFLFPKCLDPDITPVGYDNSYRCGFCAATDTTADPFTFLVFAIFHIFPGTAAAANAEAELAQRYNMTIAHGYGFRGDNTPLSEGCQAFSQ